MKIRKPIFLSWKDGLLSYWDQADGIHKCYENVMLPESFRKSKRLTLLAAFGKTAQKAALVDGQG